MTMGQQLAVLPCVLFGGTLIYAMITHQHGLAILCIIGLGIAFVIFRIHPKQ